MINDTIIANFSGININDNSLFNTGCIEENNKVLAKCLDFKLQIYSTMNNRFIVVLIILTILILYQIWTKYLQYEYTKSRNYFLYVESKIDLVIMILLAFIICYIFTM